VPIRHLHYSIAWLSLCIAVDSATGATTLHTCNWHNHNKHREQDIQEQS